MTEIEETALDEAVEGTAAPAEEPVDALPAILKCLNANHANTLALLDCLRACDVAPEDARPYREVEEELLGAASMDLTMQTPHTLIGMLVKAGGIKSVPVEETAAGEGSDDAAEPAPAEAESGAGACPAQPDAAASDVAGTASGASDSADAGAAGPSEDGDASVAAPQPADQVEDQPVDYVLYTTDAGREALAQFDPKSRFDELLGGEPEAYLELYARVLDICSGDDGATRAQIERDLKGHPALENPKRIYPEYFISKLETIGGLSWDGAWRTTEAGARILESLA